MDLLLSLLIIFGVGFFIYRAKNNSPEHNKSQKAAFLREILPDLKALLRQKDVSQGLKLLIEQYKKTINEYEYYEEDEEKEEAVEKKEEFQIDGFEDENDTPETQKVQVEVIPDSPPIDIGKIWSNWYSDNSINLLLYVGAFFIVAAASIFVGFQWGTIAGIVKATSFSIFTFVFLLCGLIFFRIKPIKTAGFTFISIAAVLIPFNGVAWFNFYFGPNGQTPGGVWLITSVLSITVYFILTMYMRRALFSYIASLGILSLVLSVVNIMHLHTEFYVLGGIFSAFILMLPGYILHDNEIESLSVIEEPLSISAQIILPITLIFGLYFALNQNVFLTYPTSISLLLSSVFYVASSRLSRKVVYLVVAQVLFPVSIYIFLRAAHVTAGHALLMVQAIPFAYLFIANYIEDNDGWLMYCTNMLAAVIAVISMIINIDNFGLYSVYTSLSLLLISIHFLTSYFIERKLDRLIIPIALFPVSLFIFMRFIGTTPAMAFIFLELLSIGYLLISYQTKKWKDESRLIFISSICVVLFSGFSSAAFIFSQPAISFGQVSVLLFIGIIFCTLSYLLFERQKSFYAVAGVLLPVFIYFLARFSGQTILISLNVVQVVGILYMVASFYIKRRRSEEQSIVETIANIVVPFTGILVSALALSDNRTLFIPEVIFSNFMGVLYYAIGYSLKKNSIYFFMAELVFLWFGYILLGWLKIETIYIFYILSTICGGYLVCSEFIKSHIPQEAEITINVAVFVPIMIFMYAVVGRIGSGQELYILSLFPAIYALCAFLLRKSVYFIALHILFELIACYLFIFDFLHVTQKFEFLGILYLCFGVIYYVASLFVKNKDISNAFIAGGFVNGALALLVTVTIPKTGSFIALIEAIVSFHYQIFGNKRYGIYIGSFLSLLAILFFLRGWNIDYFWFPLSFMSLFVIEYIIFTFVNLTHYAKDIRNASLVGAICITGYFWFSAFTHPEIKLSALYTAYILTAQVAFDAWFVREKYFGYLASVIAMLTYFWQIHLLGHTEYQLYLLPLGVYLMVLSYFTKNEQNRDISQGLEYGGLGILLVPLLFQSFGEHGFYYSWLLAAEGIILLFLGITFKKKMYRYIGIGAIVSGVVSQTYNYLFTLPQWVSAAVAGLVFISVAIYLLIKRNDVVKAVGD